jgi:hypothetical protein
MQPTAYVGRLCVTAANVAPPDMVKCFAFESAGHKRTRSDFAFQSKAFGETFMYNANVSERENRLALLSGGKLKRTLSTCRDPADDLGMA